jgi:hypothetical protein
MVFGHLLSGTKKSLAGFMGIVFVEISGNSSIPL